MIYDYRNKNSIKGVPAQDAGEELERIREKYGVLKASVIVEESKPETAVLHAAFEWDDNVAGVKYREYQARNFARCLVTKDPETKREVHAYVHIGSVEKDSERPKEGYYQSVSCLTLTEFDLAIRELLKKKQALEKAVDDLREAATKENREDAKVLIGIINSAFSTLNSAIDRLSH